LSLYENLTNCHIVKVAGHADHLGNELADALASQNENKWNKYYKQLEDRKEI
jgi:ribonuclease HI